VKRRETKSKGEKERYKHLKEEFQRIARRDKKPFLKDQCNEIEENNSTRPINSQIHPCCNASLKPMRNRVGAGNS